MMRRAVESLMQRSLRDSFARVEWIGPPPDVPGDASVILYANHHGFHDGYLLWLMARHLLHRRALTWMAEWDRFPFFAAVGAMPFPPDDPAARAGTVRRTARRFAEGPAWALVYFPEGVLHPPADGILPFDEALLGRLDVLLPRKVWLPVALHLAWEGGARPVARMAAGAAHAAVRGDEHARLSACWHDLRSRTDPATLLLEGRPGPNSRWNFSFAAPLFRRYL